MPRPILPDSFRAPLLGGFLAMLLAAAGPVVFYRHTSVQQLETARHAYEVDVAPLHPGRDRAERLDPVGSLPQARYIHETGRVALQENRPRAVPEAIERLEKMRGKLRFGEPQLVDLMISHAVGRFELDLAVDLVETPSLSEATLDQLEILLPAEGDHFGVEATLTRECEDMMSTWTEPPGEDPSLRERLYGWLVGPRLAAATVRLYHGMAEAMRQPILDVAAHLHDRAGPQSKVFEISADFLITNLQGVPVAHRAEIQGRQLVRLAIAARKAHDATGQWPNADALAAERPKDTVSAITGEDVVVEVSEDGAATIAFPGSQEVLDAMPTVPESPPRLPFRVELPGSRLEPDLV